MAITVYKPNHAYYMIATGGIVLSTDTIKAILLNTSFTPDIDTHATLSDITSNQLATGNGYTQDDKTLSTPTVTENDTDNKAYVAFDDITWTASGGDIGAFRFMALYSATSSDDTVLAIIDIGEDKTITSGNSWQPEELKFSVAGGA
jgi:hypothetical protein